jgi:hypothetical protein
MRPAAMRDENAELLPSRVTPKQPEIYEIWNNGNAVVRDPREGIQSPTVIVVTPVKGHLHHMHGDHCDDHGPIQKSA